MLTSYNVALCRYQNKVPQAWLAKSYPSLQPLASFVSDLVARMEMFHTWIQRGPPANFWLTGFFFTHAFLTGVKQNYARNHRLAIDVVDFHFECLPEGDAVCASADGAYVHGLFLEGARWNDAVGELDESHPKVCCLCSYRMQPVRVCLWYTPGGAPRSRGASRRAGLEQQVAVAVQVLISAAPTILFKPCDTSCMPVVPHYECPLYRTPERRGVLATTGHSTNFVMMLRLPSSEAQAHWIRRGVAALLSPPE